MARSAGFDTHITVFSPEGRLYQVEYSFAAVKGSGFTTVALRGDDSVVCVTQKKLPDKLMDKSYTTHLYNISANIGAVTTGLSADARALVYRAREIASKFADKNGFEIPVHYLALKCANVGQIYTQHAYMRPLAVNIIFLAMDDEKGPSLFQVDPAGYYAGYKGCASGAKEAEALNALEKIVKKKTSLPESETIQQAILCLQTVMGMDFKDTDIEVGVTSRARTGFARLGEEEIKNHLDAIAEKD